MLLTTTDIKSLKRRYRANLINSALGYKPANLVGTISPGGSPNLAIFSSAIHLGADPPLVGLVSRPDTVARHTLAYIKESKYYTINHVSESILEQAHQSSAKYPEGISEFLETGLTPHYQASFSAPFVLESEVQIGLQLKEIIPIKLNGTILIIGEILTLKVEEELILDDGSLDYEHLETVSVTGLDSYHKTHFIKKLPYAQP